MVGDRVVALAVGRQPQNLDGLCGLRWHREATQQLGDTSLFVHSHSARSVTGKAEIGSAPAEKLFILAPMRLVAGLATDEIYDAVCNLIRPGHLIVAFAAGPTIGVLDELALG